MSAYDKGYRILSDGRVLSPLGRIIKTGISASGYPRFTIRLDGRRETLYAYHLMGYQKFGEIALSYGMEVRHLNGNAADTSFENIGVGTHSQNLLDVPVHIRVSRAHAAAAHVRKLMDNEVREIRMSYESGKSLNYLKEKYKLAKSTVSYIVNRKTYDWVK